MKSIEKLRECANHESAGFFVNLEQAFGLSRYRCGDSTVKPNGGVILSAIADEIEREIDSRYMLLPVDADGMPIRPGDQMTNYTERADSLGIAKWDVVSVNERAFFDMSNGSHIPMLCHHVKRTVEDVLDDFINDDAWDKEGVYEGIKNEVIAKYAAELRMRDDS